jgi:hypothetical protein
MPRENDHTATADQPTHTPDGASTEWGPCCVCGAQDINGQRCPDCPGERERHLHSTAFKAAAASDPAAMDPTVLVRSSHENNHRGRDVCINCVNLTPEGTVIKRAG